MISASYIMGHLRVQYTTWNIKRGFPFETSSKGLLRENEPEYPEI